MIERFCTGWDIGGAHLKMVSIAPAGEISLALQLPAPVWQGGTHLHDAFAEALQHLPAGDHQHAVTMTAELADCFPDRTSGVLTLLETVEHILGSRARIYTPSGLVELPAARSGPNDAASANWHASAEIAGYHFEQAILVDIGSTTSDIIAIKAGRPLVNGYTDRLRLQYDELVYTGVVRTPVMAVARKAPVAGVWQRLASEQFATMADVYRLLRELPPEADMMPAADGGSLDMQGSARRLARMACADVDDAGLADWQALAGFIKQQQLELLEEALRVVIMRAGLAADAVIVGAGCGRFLVRELAERLQRPYRDAISLLGRENTLNRKAADYLPAYAVAALLYRDQPETVNLSN